MSDPRGTEFLESLVDSGDVIVIGTDFLFEKNQSLLCRILKFDSKKNIKKYPEKTGKDGKVIPENSVENLRMWVSPHETTFLSGSKFETKQLDPKTPITINIKTSALSPFALLQQSLKNDTGDRNEICNWVVLITRDDQKSNSSGFEYTSYTVEKKKRIGSSEDKPDSLEFSEDTKKEHNTQPAKSVSDIFASKVNTLDDVAPVYKELATSEAAKAELKDTVTETIYRIGETLISKSGSPHETYDGISAKFPKMTAILARLKLVADAAQKAINDEDIPF